VGDEKQSKLLCQFKTKWKNKKINDRRKKVADKHFEYFKRF
jgi:hypothetical protein